MPTLLPINPDFAAFVAAGEVRGLSEEGSGGIKSLSRTLFDLVLMLATRLQLSQCSLRPIFL
jgi:hypothetical protein